MTQVLLLKAFIIFVGRRAPRREIATFTQVERRRQVMDGKKSEFLSATKKEQERKHEKKKKKNAGSKAMAAMRLASDEVASSRLASFFRTFAGA